MHDLGTIIHTNNQAVKENTMGQHGILKNKNSGVEIPGTVGSTGLSDRIRFIIDGSVSLAQYFLTRDGWSFEPDLTFEPGDAIVYVHSAPRMLYVKQVDGSWDYYDPSESGHDARGRAHVDERGLPDLIENGRVRVLKKKEA